MSTNIRKRTLAHRVSTRTGLPTTDTLKTIDALLEELVYWMGMGHEVELRGFASLRLFRHRPRKGPHRVAVSFRAGRRLHARLENLARELARREREDPPDGP